MKSPQRGEVWLVDLGLAAKVRPALVMSIPAADVDRALVTIVPHTTSARGSRFEAAVSLHFLRAGVFDAQNLVTIPHAKLIRHLGKLSPAQLAVVWNAQPRCGLVFLWQSAPTSDDGGSKPVRADIDVVLGR